MSRVLITGISGFTGRYLAPLLARSGHEVIGVTADFDSYFTDEYKCYKSDITDLESISNLVRSIKPDKIIHLAGLSFVGHHHIKDFYISNVIGTRNVLQAAIDGCAGIEHVIFASSANVYGNRHSGQLDEKKPALPVNDYGISKLAAEHVCAMFSNKLPITVTRPFNYTGVLQSDKMLIPKIVGHVRRKAPFIELGNINVARDFSDVRYVAEIYARLIDCDVAINKTVNICSGRAYSLRDILELASNIGGHTPEIRVNKQLIRDSEVDALWGSKEFLTKLIGPVEMPPLAETIRWMMETDTEGCE